MKTICNYINEKLTLNNSFMINERLSLNNQSKLNNRYHIPTKFSKNIIYTENEIKIIQQYAQKLRIHPIILTNYEYDNVKSKLDYTNNSINLFYDNNWETKNQLTYILLWKYKGWWRCFIRINNKGNNVATKTGEFFKSKNVENVCKELLVQIERTKFYDEVKKLK